MRFIAAVLLMAAVLPPAVVSSSYLPEDRVPAVVAVLDQDRALRSGVSPHQDVHCKEHQSHWADMYPLPQPWLIADAVHPTFREPALMTADVMPREKPPRI